MKEKRPIITQGMVCSFDPFNRFKQDDCEINYVIALELKKKSRNPFKQLWIVRNAEDDTAPVFTVAEITLEPSNVAVIRLDSRSPKFNEFDADALKYAYDFIEDYYKLNFADFQFKYSKTYDKKKQNRLLAMIDKIKFFEGLREV